MDDPPPSDPRAEEKARAMAEEAAARAAAAEREAIRAAQAENASIWAAKASALLNKALDPVVEPAEHAAFFDKVREIMHEHDLDFPEFRQVQPRRHRDAPVPTPAPPPETPRGATDRRCAHCGKPLPKAALTGRPRRYHDACRVAAYRKRHS
jgi:hypothetical protein